jgi:glycosyl transferase, family 25
MILLHHGRLLVAFVATGGKPMSDTPHRFLAAARPLTVINLPERTDRRRAFERQLVRAGLEPGGPDVEVFPAIRPAGAGGFPTIGAHGCFLSHLEVLRRARDRGQDRLVLCEDDLDFAPDFAARLPAVLRALEREPWDILYAGHDALCPGRVVDAEAGLCEVPPDTPVLCSHFLVLRGPVIGELAGYLDAILQRPPGDPAGGPMHVDGAYSWFRRAMPQRRTLAAVPPLGRQRASRSDIHALKWFDRLPLLRGAATVLRDLALPRRPPPRRPAARPAVPPAVPPAA